MINDIKNSINKILHERLTSPFYGTLVLSWLIWNWRILYLTFFVSEDKIHTDKISYITSNFSELKFIVFLPLISTIILITIFPFITNRAYWISLLYNQWKINKRNEIQKKELLTLEQSIDLREQIKSQEKRFEELLEDKNLKIKQLESQISASTRDKLPSDSAMKFAQKKIESFGNTEIKKVADKILNDKELKSTYDFLSRLIQRRERIMDYETGKITDQLNFFLINDIVENDESGKFKYTDFGKAISKLIYEK